jgi:hypothetical protein
VIGGDFLVDDEAAQIDYVRSIGLDGFQVSRFDGEPFEDTGELDRLGAAIAAANGKDN